MTYVQMDALSRALFNTDLKTFLTDGWDGSAVGASNVFTMAELFNVGGISNYGIWSGHKGKISLMDFMKGNLRRGSFQAVGTVIGTQILNAGLKKAGVYRNANKLVRSVPSIGKMVKF